MSASPDDCLHLTVEHVSILHAEALHRFGGLEGVRDQALLESAVAAPQAGYGGRSVYDDQIDVAAAYLFYLCRNHPFLDGNKRTALAACLLFLRLNHVELPQDGPDWEALTLDVAAGRLERDGATARLRAILEG